MHITNKAISTGGKITALLGPTNTGKTWHAIDRMLAYKNGVIGFPLRLLARENYDRVAKIKGASQVALITGEEKILPPKARYFLCTVEAMPTEREFEFLGIDEIQLCGDAERGHVFTDRLLRARGKVETFFMGSDTIQPLVALLVPGVDFVSRERFSKLSYTGFKKLGKLPPRSAAVAFSVNDVYNIAEIIRRQRGGTAVVLGALSPRTRQAQVDMYQAGEVDFMVATDAIGMGLNMDINHVALAATRKFDGARARPLTKNEMAQIAGRAGRYTKDGTFGTSGPVKELDAATVEAIETHNFDTLKKIYWRNSELDFSSAKALQNSLDAPSNRDALIRGHPADDQKTLANLIRRKEIQKLATNKDNVRLLWDVCQIPDFRKTLSEQHHKMAAEIFVRLMDGPLPEDWVADHVSRLERTDGNVDTLMARIAHVRTWTYISHHANWLRHSAEWQDKTRAIEDRLSDVLHEALTRRFVDQRAAVLIRSLEERRELLAGIRENGEIIVEGQPVGFLKGFKFIPAEDTEKKDYRAVFSAARNALKKEITRRKNLMLNAQDSQFTLKEDGTLCYQSKLNNPVPGEPVAKVCKGETILRPDIDLLESDLLEDSEKEAVKQHLKGWLHRHVDSVLEPLKTLETEDAITAPARGICYQVREALGIIPRHVVEPLIGELDPEGRAALRARKVKLGPVLVFIPALNKPAAVRLRALLWSLWHDKPLPAPVPADGIVSVTVDRKEIDPRFYRAMGYPVYGPRAVRIDMLDGVINSIYDSAEKGVFKAKHEMAEWLGCPILDLYEVLEAMGHRKIDDPAENAAAAPATEETREETHKPETDPSAENPEDPPDATSTEEGEGEGEEQKEEPKKEARPEQKKPELATFRLKKGKASDRPKHAPHKKRDQDKKGKKRQGKPEQKPRVMEAGLKARPEDSPFAILQQLKDKLLLL